MGKIPRILFKASHLQREYEHVSRYFDITSRTTSEPYFPPPRLCLAEDDLLQNLEKFNNPDGLSVYLHIPFCEGKCTFCDLYCFNVPVRKRAIIDRFLDVLEGEIEFWGRFSDWSHREVTTIHFGGGSPLFVGTTQIEHLLKILNKHFAICRETEIAIEITTSQVTPKNLDFFKSSDISRIHVGIQTLSDPIRKIIGRRESAREVLKKLEGIRKADFVMSVDMLYGLPLQSMESFLKDLNTCIRLNVDGFALYELQISRVLNRIIQQNAGYHIDKSLSYQMLMTGKRLLNDSGYENVFYNHYGNPRDKNLYFTYPIRGEDCLAFGPMADGSIGRVVYRHSKYQKYINSVTMGGAGIDFGYIEDEGRAAIREFETYLTSTRIPAEGLRAMRQRFGPAFEGIFDLWQKASLVESADQAGHFRLTGSGCWLLAMMMDQVRRLTIHG